MGACIQPAPKIKPLVESVDADVRRYRADKGEDHVKDADLVADHTDLEAAGPTGVADRALDGSRLVVEGLEEQPHFHRFAIQETGTLDTEKVAAEVVGAGRHLLARDETIKALLLECSLLPPYAAALQTAVQVPVFDYITMINFVFSTVVKQSYEGFV